MAVFVSDLKNRQYSVAVSLIHRIIAADLALRSRLSSSLHALENVTGHQRSALVLSSGPGAPPALIGHGCGAGGDLAELAELMNVQRILSGSGERGVVRSVLNSGEPVVLEDVGTSALYVPGDVAIRSEACVSICVGVNFRLALNLENGQVGAFAAEDLLGMQQIALIFAGALEGSDLSATPPFAFHFHSIGLH